MRNERIDEKDIPYAIETEVLQALEHVQMAYQGYLHAIDRLHIGIGKKGLQRPGAQARLRVLTQYADLLNVKLELALEPRKAVDRLKYLLDQRKINKRTEVLREAIHRLQSKPPVPINKKQTVSRSIAEPNPPPAPHSDDPLLPEPRPIRISIGNHETVRTSGAEIRVDAPYHESDRQAKSAPRTLNRPVIRLTVSDHTPAPAQNTQRQGTGTPVASTAGRPPTVPWTEGQPVIRWSVPDLPKREVPANNVRDQAGNPVMGFSDNLMPHLTSEGRHAVSPARSVRSKPLLLNNIKNIGRS